jgi:hypothetical protein
MKARIRDLNQEREAIISEQGTLFAQILADSKNPELIGMLLCRVTDSAVRYHITTDALAKANDEASKTPRWLRIFS